MCPYKVCILVPKVRGLFLFFRFSFWLIIILSIDSLPEFGIKVLSSSKSFISCKVIKTNERRLHSLISNKRSILPIHNFKFLLLDWRLLIDLMLECYHYRSLFRYPGSSIATFLLLKIKTLVIHFLITPKAIDELKKYYSFECQCCQ
jgi:hypothetical protein